MNLIRSTVLTLSVTALMFSVGSSAMANSNYYHPEFSVTENRTLSLRETGSQIVMETIEDAIRQGGLALLGEGFQVDSSLSYVTEESSDGTIKGEIDFVLPFYNKNGHVVFTQPGFVFWEGLAEEERVDGNLGIVYRTNLANTPIGIDAVGGVSLFYDYDLHRVGHERLGIGMDMQGGNFHGAFNYYHPLSNEENGREGFVEEALKGMDLRVALEREAIRAGARVGLWRYDGGEDVADEWRSSVGLEGGVRIVPGVFIEGEWEKHQEDVILDQRLSLGLAFRFSLPNFEGQSYGDDSMSSNLYRIVEREKRILYEEREDVPKVRLSVGERTRDDSMGETTISVEVELPASFTENVVLNLIGTGSVAYNDDWTISVGGTDCTVVDGTDCAVTVMAGETSPDDEVVITFQDPARGEPAEDIILSVEITSTGVDLAPGNPLVEPIPPGDPLPTVSFNYDRNDTLTLNRGGAAMLNATLDLSEELTEDVTVNITTSGTAVYGHQDDWDLARRVPAGDEDVHYSLCGTTCEVMFAAGQTSADVQFTAYFGSAGKTVGAEIQLPAAAQSLLRVGNPSRLDFTIGEPPPAPSLPTVSLDYSGSTTVGSSDRVRMMVRLSEALTQDDVTITLTDTAGGATYDRGTVSGWALGYNFIAAGATPPAEFDLMETNSGTCDSVAAPGGCSITISQGQTTLDLLAVLHSSTGGQTITLTLGVGSASSSLVAVGTPSTHTLTVQ